MQKNAVLKNCLSERKFKHCVYEERQPQIMYQKMMSMYLPRCATIATEGYCDCEKENECGMR